MLGGLAAALLFLAIWTPFHPPLTQPPTGDVYTHLSVARNLCRGEGFVTDVAYPLSFAFPFARKLPQPLIHRDPGFPLLITLPHLAAGGDPVRVLAAARILQLILLGATIWIGAAAYLARRRARNLVPWLLLLAFNPMVGFAVNWIFVELGCGLLLLVLWLRVRDAGPVEPDRPGRRKWRGGLLDGLLDGFPAGLLLLLRLDLFWVPVLWWIVLRRRERQRTVLALLVVLVAMAPWAVRNIRLTGQPFFSVQSQAELVKGIPAWPDYTVYQQLEPQPVSQAIRQYPRPLLRKAARGVKFQLLNLHRLLPRWYWAGLGLLLLVGVAGRRPGMRSAPLFTLCATAGLLIVQYSFFDHSLRHLFVLLPALVWELAPWTGDVFLGVVDRRWRLPPRWRNPAGILVSAGLTLAGILCFPCALPGWEGEARYAAETDREIRNEAEIAALSPDPVLFVKFTAVAYFADRAAVWEPSDPVARERIRQWLAPGSDPLPEDLTP